MKKTIYILSIGILITFTASLVFGQHNKTRRTISRFDASLDRQFENAGFNQLKKIQAKPNAITAPNIDGKLDQAFGTNGIVITDFADNARLTRQVEIQPDGKIVVLGWIIDANSNITDPYLIRYNPDGSIDNGFGTNGKVVTDCVSYCFGDGFVILPNGKIFVATYMFVSGRFTFAVSRLNQDGTLDTSWGTNGILPVSIVNGESYSDEILVQPDGKIVLFGSTQRGTSQDDNIGIARLNSDGTIDDSFGTNGYSNIQIPNHTGYSGVPEVLMQPDGKFLLLYQTFDRQINGVVRVNPTGTLDTTFADNGLLNATQFFSFLVRALALQPDGKFILVTRQFFAAGVYSVAERYNPDGTLDQTFGTNGRFVSPTNNLSFRAVVVQSNGKIIIGGLKSSAGPSFEYMLMRLNENGSTDTSFGTDGLVTTALSNFESAITSMVLQSDGKLVVLGYVLDPNGSGDVGLARYVLEPPHSVPFDFDGDGKADISVFRPSDNVWYLNRSTSGFSSTQFGLPDDILAPADFDGDGITDIAVFREGIWYALQSSNSEFFSIQFGLGTDVPVPADFDGDGRAELAVYRNGIWYLLNLANNQTTILQFGLANDKPVVADYDADGKADLAVYRDGIWYLQRSTSGFAAIQFGLATDKPIVGDYDGDRKSDLCVYRNGEWHILADLQNYSVTQFGLANDIPVAADYDGDGKTDMAVFRHGIWYMLRSQQGFGAEQFGSTNDKPIPAAFLP